MSKRVSVEDVGSTLLNSMREVYHYACQFNGDTEARSAALLAVFLYIDELRTEIYEDFTEACIDQEMDPDQVMDHMPEELWQSVEDFIADHVLHGDQVHVKVKPEKPFTFNQMGIGVA